MVDMRFPLPWLWNIGWLSPDYMTLYLRRHNTSSEYSLHMRNIYVAPPLYKFHITKLNVVLYSAMSSVLCVYIRVMYVCMYVCMHLCSDVLYLCIHVRRPLCSVMSRLIMWQKVLWSDIPQSSTFHNHSQHNLKSPLVFLYVHIVFFR
jgi:hypothetical protein